jgi:hypothetical protein
MVAPRNHRRGLNTNLPPMEPKDDTSSRRSRPQPTLNTTMSLRKGSTFHTPTTPPSEQSSPTVVSPSMPRRSDTCPQSLEEFLAAGRNTKRVADILGSFDRSYASIKTSPRSTKAIEEVLPVPRMLLDAAVSTPTIKVESSPTIESMEYSPAPSPTTPRTRERRQDQASDSGIGSSVGTHSDIKCMSSNASPVHQILTTSATTSYRKTGAGLGSSATTITTMSSDSKSSKLAYANMPIKSNLSVKSAQKMMKIIVTPLVNERSFREFRQIVIQAPPKIAAGEIVCLRDLEKYLIYTATVSYLFDGVVVSDAHNDDKETAKSPATYLKFMETSIQHVRAAVEVIPEEDQRRKDDKPYTDGYFLDLTEQIRHYAHNVRAARERIANGERDDFEYDPYELRPPLTYLTNRTRTETLEMRGGMNENGRPVQLVRVKNGKAICIGADQKEYVSPEPKKGYQTRSRVKSEYEGDYEMIKRSLSSESFDDSSVLRSAGRRVRRRVAEAEREMAPQVCNFDGCGKTYKRPCDLTKHEKTHTRPWKCMEPKCRYHEDGWPTEKERDRHYNDKHSSQPTMYQCQYHDCHYKSKRESNCKQHMEKAHGWTYVKSKKNGKAPARNDEQTPAATVETPSSYGGGIPTPITRDASYDHVQNRPTRPLVSVAGEEEFSAPYSTMDGNTYGSVDFDFNDFSQPIPTSAHTLPSVTDIANYLSPEYTSPAGPSNTNAPLDWANNGQFDENFGDFSFNNDMTSYNMTLNQLPTQLLTPEMSAEQTRHDSFDSMSNSGMSSNGQMPYMRMPAPAPVAGPSFSPRGQDQPLFNVEQDEGFDEMLRGQADFRLLDSDSGSMDGVPLFTDATALAAQQIFMDPTDPMAAYSHTYYEWADQ